MNKKEFVKYIDEQLEGLTLEQQVKVLQRIQELYLPSLIHSRQKKMGVWVPPEEIEDYMFCEKCNKYSLKKKCKSDFVNEVRIETTYRDAGYGDGDMEGEVEYLVTYLECPLCGNRQKTKKMRVRVIREWNRREGRR